jgi:hypothetical protein
MARISGRGFALFFVTSGSQPTDATCDSNAPDMTGAQMARFFNETNEPIPRSALNFSASVRSAAS